MSWLLSRTIRVFPLAAFDCTVGEYRQMFGDDGLPEQAPFPHDRSQGRIHLSADDSLRYGAVRIFRGFVVRPVVCLLEGGTDELRAVAVYGKCVGPRRRLKNGWQSVRVRPLQKGTEDAAAAVIEQARAKGELDVGQDASAPIVVLVRDALGRDCWSRRRQFELPDDR